MCPVYKIYKQRFTLIKNYGIVCISRSFQVVFYKIILGGIFIMWKKPSIQKPDFKKVNLDEMSEKESLDTNGGLISIKPPVIIPIIPPLSGMVAKPFDFTDDFIIFKK